jgi:plastocyanin
MSITLRVIALLLASTVAPRAFGAVVEIELFNFRFVPNDVTIQAGDTVRWINRMGVHDVRADDGSFAFGPPGSGWTFERTFNSAGVVRVYCSVHSAPGLDINTSMNGRITVQPAAPTFAINQGIAGAWFNPATNGQGFLIDIEPASRFIFIAWFTYERQAQNKVGAPEHRWLTAQGNYTGAAANGILIFRTSGGIFNNPQATTTTPVGTMNVSFTDCSTGSITFNLTSDSLTGTIPIQRVIPGTQALCQMLSGASPAEAQAAP